MVLKGQPLATVLVGAVALTSPGFCLQRACADVLAVPLAVHHPDETLSLLDGTVFGQWFALTVGVSPDTDTAA